MQRPLISVKHAKDVDGVSGFVDGEGDQEGEPLHRFTTDISVADGRGGGQFGDAIKILCDQFGEAVTQIGSDGVVLLDGYRKWVRVKKGMVGIIRADSRWRASQTKR
jgi:hypothetical protein